IGGKSSEHFHAARREPGRGGVLAGVEAARRRVGHTAERDRPVMVGEALDHAVATRQLPAAAKRGDAAGKVRRQPRIDRSHRRISTSGIAGMSPAAKWLRFTSRRSTSKRTGTSKRKPAVI